MVPWMTITAGPEPNVRYRIRVPSADVTDPVGATGPGSCEMVPATVGALIVVSFDYNR
jgi:hypothetical protein